MKLYIAHVAGIEDTLIIARSGSHAAQIFVTSWTAVRDSPPGEFDISQCSLPRITILQELRELVAGDVSGVLHIRENGELMLEPM